MTSGATLTTTIRQPVRSSWPPLGAAVQAGLIAVTLAICLVLPRAGQAVLLVPLTHDARALGGISLPRVTVVGRGPLPGSLVVRPTGPVAIWALLREGIVPVAVPLALCSQPVVPPAAAAKAAVPVAANPLRGSHG